MILLKILKIAFIYDQSFITAYKAIGSGCAVISIAGSGIGIGVIFGCLIISYSINPNAEEQIFTYAIMGFALTEAIALFGLMISLLILFG